MTIREIENKDFEQIKDLLVELQEYVIEIDKFKLNIISPEYRNEYFEYMLNDCLTQQGKIFVAEEDGVLKGFIAGFVYSYDERDKLDYLCPKKGVVAELIVSKKSRSKGTGNLLITQMEKYFKEINCKYVQIDVFAYNEIARRFYNKYGYEERLITLFKSLN